MMQAVVIKAVDVILCMLFMAPHVLSFVLLFWINHHHGLWWNPPNSPIFTSSKLWLPYRHGCFVKKFFCTEKWTMSIESVQYNEQWQRQSKFLLLQCNFLAKLLFIPLFIVFPVNEHKNICIHGIKNMLALLLIKDMCCHDDHKAFYFNESCIEN